MIIHTFDDMTSDINTLINKRWHSDRAVCVDFKHVHSFGTDDFVGWETIPDVLYVDGHMPGGWTRIFDWLYENKSRVTKPILVVPNSSDSYESGKMIERIGLLHHLGLNIYSNYDVYAAATGNHFLATRATIYDYPAYAMLLEFAQSYTRCGLGSSAPITRALYDAVQAEWYADKLLKPYVRLLDKAGLVFNGSSIVLSDPAMEFTAPAIRGVDLHRSHYNKAEFDSPASVNESKAIFAAVAESRRVDLELPITAGLERQAKVSYLASCVAGPENLNLYIDVMQRLIGYDIDVALVATVEKTGGVMGYCDRYHYIIYVFSDSEDSFKVFEHWWKIINKHANFLIGDNAVWRRPLIDFAFAADRETFENAYNSIDCIIRSNRSI